MTLLLGAILKKIMALDKIKKLRNKLVTFQTIAIISTAIMCATFPTLSRMLTDDKFGAINALEAAALLLFSASVSFIVCTLIMVIPKIVSEQVKEVAYHDKLNSQCSVWSREYIDIFSCRPQELAACLRDLISVVPKRFNLSRIEATKLNVFNSKEERHSIKISIANDTYHRPDHMRPITYEEFQEEIRPIREAYNELATRRKAHVVSLLEAKPAKKKKVVAKKTNVRTRSR